MPRQNLGLLALGKSSSTSLQIRDSASERLSRRSMPGVKPNPGMSGHTYEQPY
ncbi:MAG: hypothetical protein OXC26_14430 [Albidovulum sp.]|nr:hypothetical protein [Albidovulum sp.]